MMSSFSNENLTVPAIILEGATFLPHNNLKLELSNRAAAALMERWVSKDSRLANGSPPGLGSLLVVFTAIPKGLQVKGGTVDLISSNDPVKIYVTGCLAEITQMQSQTETGENKFILLLKGLKRCTFVQEEARGILHAKSNTPANLPLLTVKPYDLAIDGTITKEERHLLERKLKAHALMLWILFPHMRSINILKTISDENASACVIADLIVQAVEEKEFLAERLAVLSSRSEQELLARSLHLLNKIKPMQSLVNSSAELKRLQENKLGRGLRGAGGAGGGVGRDEDGDEDELQELRDKFQDLSASQSLPEIVRSTIQKELKRLKKTPPSSPEYTVGRSYVETLLEVPWSKHSSSLEALDLDQASGVLEEEHYGLQEVKNRILQFIAVSMLTNGQSGVKEKEMSSSVKKSATTILCLAGPPGVGKTSLGKSIAKALGRKFERIALGGVYDEAELRGHRRTYVGSLPGVIVQAVKRAGCVNPVILLDEIDKLGSRQGRMGVGDPQAALLEILDPDQNNSFRDHYLALPLDLSQVVFIATANYLENISPPLLDRMEVIQISGYTVKEKMSIARRHLIERQAQATGVKGVKFTDQALQEIVQGYTREAGVRQLEREIGNICRYDVVDVVAMEQVKASKETAFKLQMIDIRRVADILGSARYNSDAALAVAPAGVVTGMAWTGTGGELLFIEAVSILHPNSSVSQLGSVSITGNIGKVMEESCQLALDWIRANYDKVLGYIAHAHIDVGAFQSRVFHANIRVHIPGGAISKDGPSAGCAITSALLSVLTGIPVDAKLCMTGEITLRGAVLPVGGIKEKVLAACRGKIRRVILPSGNRKDFEKIEMEGGQTLVTVDYVDTMEQLIRAVFNDSKQTSASSSSLQTPRAVAMGDHSMDLSGSAAGIHLGRLLRSQL